MAIYQGGKILSGGGPSPFSIAEKAGFEGTEAEFNELLANIDEAATKEELENAINNIPAPDVSGQISEHNIDKNAHNDIRQAIEALDEAIINKVDKEDLTNHINDKNNPHGVTASQIGAAPSSHSHSMVDIIDLDVGGGGADVLTATTSTSIMGTSSAGSGYASFTSSYSSIPDVSISGSYFTIPAGYTKACIIAHADLVQESVWKEPSIQILKNGSSIRSYTLSNCNVSARIPITLSATCAVASGDTISLYGSAPYDSGERTAIYFTGIAILLFK